MRRTDDLCHLYTDHLYHLFPLRDLDLSEQIDPWSA